VKLNGFGVVSDPDPASVVTQNCSDTPPTTRVEHVCVLKLLDDVTLTDTELPFCMRPGELV